MASRTLTEPLAWENTTLLQGDAVDAVAELKRQGDGDLHVIGSSRLAQELIANELVDEFRLMIDPVIVGGGKRFFADDGALRSLRLVESTVTRTGAILATYGRADE